MAIRRGIIVSLLLSLFSSACNSPIATPLPETIALTLTLTPTTVPISPTAEVQPSPVPPPADTPTPESTPTPVPPTATIKPTMKSTQGSTKTASARPPVSAVSERPSNVLKSIQQANSAAQAFVNQVNLLFHGDVSLCAPMLAAFDNLINAPTYDVSAQSSNIQQAYSLYRNAIAEFNAQGFILRKCGGSGVGTINSAELGVAFRAVSEGASLIAQGWNLVQSEPSLSPAGSPLLVAIRQAMYDSDVLGEFRSRITLPGGTPTWAFPRNVTAFPCNDYFAIYNRIVNAPTFDVSDMTANAQGAYAKYREAIAFMAEIGGHIAGRCTAQEGGITNKMIFDLMYGGATAHNLYSQAIQLLTQ